jgi:predicted RNA-binding Zn-ribbon protein involved in translation (DUF1610 family)
MAKKFKQNYSQPSLFEPPSQLKSAELESSTDLTGSTAANQQDIITNTIIVNLVCPKCGSKKICKSSRHGEYDGMYFCLICSYGDDNFYFNPGGSSSVRVPVSKQEALVERQPAAPKKKKGKKWK